MRETKQQVTARISNENENKLLLLFSFLYCFPLLSLHKRIKTGYTPNFMQKTDANNTVLAIFFLASAVMLIGGLLMATTMTTDPYTQTALAVIRTPGDDKIKTGEENDDNIEDTPLVPALEMTR
jgi:hypothetical protein